MKPRWRNVGILKCQKIANNQQVTKKSVFYVPFYVSFNVLFEVSSIPKKHAKYYYQVSSKGQQIQEKQCRGFFLLE